MLEILKIIHIKRGKINFFQYPRQFICEIMHLWPINMVNNTVKKRVCAIRYKIVCFCFKPVFAHAVYIYVGISLFTLVLVRGEVHV